MKLMKMMKLKSTIRMLKLLGLLRLCHASGSRSPKPNFGGTSSQVDSEDESEPSEDPNAGVHLIHLMRFVELATEESQEVASDRQ